MPELPEVETTRRGLEPLVTGRILTGAVVRQPRLRWRIDPRLAERVAGRPVTAVERRAKYLLLRLDGPTVILHLGMSGSLRVVPASTPPAPHDHVDLCLSPDRVLRLRDPRRFGALFWTSGDPLDHPRLKELGPEPLGDLFDGAWLASKAAGRRLAVKPFIMESRVVVGVGNIYASEALHRAAIRPATPAGRLSPARWARLATAIREVLAEAIEAGGTTLRDFSGADGRPGYFEQRLAVYGREGEPCPRCGGTIRRAELGQRSTFWCPRCQR